MSSHNSHHLCNKQHARTTTYINIDAHRRRSTLDIGRLNSQLHQVPESALRLRSNRLKSPYVQLAVQPPQQAIQKKFLRNIVARLFACVRLKHNLRINTDDSAQRLRTQFYLMSVDGFDTILMAYWHVNKCR